MPSWTPILEAALRAMNPGEQSVARKLEEQLPTSVQIIPNYRWQVIKNYKAPIDLEADFIIIWPHRGIAILEVKAGSVDWDATRNVWTGICSRSPTEQARNSRTDLCERLARTSTLGETDKIWRDRVQSFPCFPDVERDRFPASMDGYERESILGRNELKHIGHELDHLTSRTTHQCSDLTEERCQSLVKMLCPSVNLVPRISHILENEAEKIDWATNQSLIRIEGINEFRFVFISGSAGTGKTLHGLTALKMWLKDGHRSFYISTNPHLVRYLQLRFPDYKEYIISLADFLRKIAKINLPPEDPLSESDLLDGLYRPVPTDDINGISVIIDEAQDLSNDVLDGFIALCDYRKIWILYDDQQILKRGEPVSVFEKRIESVAGQAFGPLRLKYNLRNTQQIGKYAAQWVETTYAPADELPIGEPPIIIHVQDELNHDFKLRGILNSIFHESKFSNKDVVILSCLPTEVILKKYTSPQGEKQFGRRFSYIDSPSSPGTLRISSVLDFKGQETPVVLLIDTRDTTIINSYYIGSSRAIHRLYVIAFESQVVDSSKGLNEQIEEAGFDI